MRLLQAQACEPCAVLHIASAEALHGVLSPYDTSTEDIKSKARERERERVREREKTNVL
jgi:hypothetical protein